MFKYMKYASTSDERTVTNILITFKFLNQHQMGNSKLTDKFHAGRGRALKELSRRSPKAEVCKIHSELVLSSVIQLP